MSGAVDVLSVAEDRTHHRLTSGRTEYYLGESVRLLLQNCFPENRSTHSDPHQQITGLNANQKIQFVKAVDLEVFLATFGMLEDLLLEV